MPSPKPDPILAVGNMSPYVIDGVTYEVIKEHRSYQERGIASWYGAKFTGHETSNGELYDVYQPSAAHKSLPIPCYARVTNLENGKSIVVRVNDRGPFHSDRLIDLSYAAAVKLGYMEKGTARSRGGGNKCGGCR
jgi:rare lipoprotein A